MDFAGRYTAGQARWVALVEPLADDMAVPAVSPWTLRDLIAHLTGVAADLASGNVDDWSLPHWTEAQVTARAGRSRAELLEEWAGLVPAVAAGFANLDEAYGRMALVDLCGHEDDVREAAGASRTIDALDWAIVGEHRRLMADAMIGDAGLPALRIRTPEGDDWVVGGETPAGEVTVARQEAWRSMTGRRTRDDVRGFAWTVDPEPYIERGWKNATFHWPEDS